MDDREFRMILAGGSGVAAYNWYRPEALTYLQGEVCMGDKSTMQRKQS